MSSNKKKQPQERPGMYQVVGTISRETRDGRTYSESMYAGEHSSDVEAVSAWKKTIAAGATIVRYTVIFIGIFLVISLIAGLAGLY